jgi:signal transduction histidine kinase
MMLSEFIAANRDDILTRSRNRVLGRAWPSVSSREIEDGVPLFLTQLTDTLRRERTVPLSSTDAIGSAAARYGADLSAAGFAVTQVVHDYGDICQVIMEIAIEQQAPITVEEYQTLNGCLDTAIAEAVTEHARLTAGQRSDDEVQRLGQASHELRDLLNNALLAFHALRRGSVPINGSTGAVLGRSLTSLRDVVDRMLSEVRLAAGKRRTERVSVTMFVDDIAATGVLHSEYRGVRFTVLAADPTLAIDGDPLLLTSAVMNLLHNAFKYTPAGGTVTLRAYARAERLLIEIEDECGGIPEHKQGLFQAFGNRQGTDRSGLGLGLSMARQAIRAHGGEIQVLSIAGKGCVFTIDLPLAAKENLP